MKSAVFVLFKEQLSLVRTESNVAFEKLLSSGLKLSEITKNIVIVDNAILSDFSTTVSKIRQKIEEFFDDEVKGTKFGFLMSISCMLSWGKLGCFSN